MDQQYNPQYVPPAAPRNSTLAIISLIAGIAGLSLVPFLGSIAAVITGHMAKKEIKNSAGTIGGNGLATAGLVLGYLGIAGGLCLFCLLIVLPLLGIGLSIPFFNVTNSSGMLIPFISTL